MRMTRATTVSIVGLEAIVWILLRIQTNVTRPVNRLSAVMEPGVTVVSVFQMMKLRTQPQTPP